MTICVFALMAIFGGGSAPAFESNALCFAQVPDVAADLGLTAAQKAQVALVYAAAVDDACGCMVQGRFFSQRWLPRAEQYDAELRAALTPAQWLRLAQIGRQPLGLLCLLDDEAAADLDSAQRQVLAAARNAREAALSPTKRTAEGDAQAERQFLAAAEALLRPEQHLKVFGKPLPKEALKKAPRTPAEVAERRAALDQKLRPLGIDAEQFLVYVYAPGMADALKLNDETRLKLDSLLLEAGRLRGQWERDVAARQPMVTPWDERREGWRSSVYYWNGRVDAAVDARQRELLRAAHISMRGIGAVFDEPIRSDLKITMTQRLGFRDQMVAAAAAATAGRGRRPSATLVSEMMTATQRSAWAALAGKPLPVAESVLRLWTTAAQDRLGMPIGWQFLHARSAWPKNSSKAAASDGKP